jgi:chromosome segregation ATPase
MDPATMSQDSYPSQYPPGQIPPAQLDGHYLQPPNVTGDAFFAGQVTASQRALQLLEENAQLLAEIRRLQAVEQDLASRLGQANNELLQTSQQNAALQNSLRDRQQREQQLLTDVETLRREKSDIMEQSRLLVTTVEQTLDEILFNQLSTPPVSDR